MANHASALKRHRQSQRRRLRNRAAKSALKTERKKFETTLQTGDAAATKGQFTSLQKTLDKAAAKGLIHKKTASRLVARASARQVKK